MRILIVDAEPRRPRQLRIILSCLGLRLTNVLNAQDLRAASGLLIKRPFDCVFMHIELTDGGAFEAVHIVRNKVLPSTKVCVYGPTTTRQHVLEARTAGASSFLVYPFTTGDVKVAIYPFRNQPNAGRTVTT